MNFLEVHQDQSTILNQKRTTYCRDCKKRKLKHFTSKKSDELKFLILSKNYLREILKKKFQKKK